MFGFDRERVIGQPLSFLMPERFRPMHDARPAAGRRAARVLAHHRQDGRGRRPARGRGRVPDRALAVDVGDRRGPLLRRHHPRHRRRASRPRTRPGCSRPRRTRSSRSTPRAGSCWPTHARSSCSATSAQSWSGGRSRSSSPRIPAAARPTASTPPAWTPTWPTRPTRASS